MLNDFATHGVTSYRNPVSPSFTARKYVEREEVLIWAVDDGQQPLLGGSEQSFIKCLWSDVVIWPNQCLDNGGTVELM